MEPELEPVLKPRPAPLSSDVQGERQQARKRGRRPEAHLTNSSLHASSLGYERNGAVSADGVGSKWSLDAFWRHIQSITREKEPGAQGGTASLMALRPSSRLFINAFTT